MNNPIDISEHPEVKTLISLALQEDGAQWDITTLSLVNPDIEIKATVLARHPCRVAGGDVARAVFLQLDASLKIEQLISDGSDAKADDILLLIKGKASPILSGERTALNFMQRMTGIATLTQSFVMAVSDTKCKILDTRKTASGMRVLDKYSVKCGGGTNHRLGLCDMVLIKDNHRRLWKNGNPDNLGQAIVEARKKFPDTPIEVEVENLTELQSALTANPEWIMLDNMPLEKMREAVILVNGRCKIEASGGITMGNVRNVAHTGVDAISLGCLTHSVTAADLSLEIL